MTWRLESGLSHIGIVSDQHAAAGIPPVTRNFGAGTARDDLSLPIR